MIFEKAAIGDISELVTLRIAYLEEDGGTMDNGALVSIKTNLPDYFVKHLNNDITAYVARNEQEIVACALLLVIEKPMSPAFITGKTGTVLNVYTKPNYRHNGYARCLMKMLLSDAVDKNLSLIELKATEDGYSLYKSLGFKDDVSDYHLMKWHNNK
ncbi:MAG: GNAT family N-acetyltransferase [Oscillospiraceae bacterium]|nr:GNAT family N-acetyltransferase [Oscillospiraceae bacterium]